jgi:hypothetical protein
MVVLDLSRKIETQIPRDDLYQLGNCTDWFALAHGLRVPKAGYQLTAAAAPAHAPRLVEACHWYTLAQGGHRTTLCRSASAHLPLLMVDERGQIQWQLAALDRTQAPESAFVVSDLGVVRNNATQDLSRD